MNPYVLTVAPGAVAAAAMRSGSPMQTVGASGFYPTYRPYPGAQEMAGAVTTDDIVTQEQQVSALMDATNAAVLGCTALDSPTITMWRGLYGSWQQWDGKLKPCLQYGGPSVSPPDLTCLMDFGMTWTSVQQQLATYQQQAVNYQARVHGACPSFNPSPNPNPQPSGGGGAPTCGWFDRLLGKCSPTDTSTSWPTAIKWGALALVALAGLYYFGPALAAVAGGLVHHVGGRKELES